MSALGAWLPTRRPLPAGERFELRFPLPGSESQLVALKAEVMWSQAQDDGRGAGMGVEFVNLSEANEHQLRGALARYPDAMGDRARFRFTDSP